MSNSKTSSDVLRAGKVLRFICMKTVFQVSSDKLEDIMSAISNSGECSKFLYAVSIIPIEKVQENIHDPNIVHITNEVLQENLAEVCCYDSNINFEKAIRSIASIEFNDLNALVVSINSDFKTASQNLVLSSISNFLDFGRNLLVKIRVYTTVVYAKRFAGAEDWAQCRAIMFNYRTLINQLVSVCKASDTTAIRDLLEETLSNILDESNNKNTLVFHDGEPVGLLPAFTINKIKRGDDRGLTHYLQIINNNRLLCGMGMNYATLAASIREVQEMVTTNQGFIPNAAGDAQRIITVPARESNCQFNIRTSVRADAVDVVDALCFPVRGYPVQEFVLNRNIEDLDRRVMDHQIPEMLLEKFLTWAIRSANSGVTGRWDLEVDVRPPHKPFRVGSSD